MKTHIHGAHNQLQSSVYLVFVKLSSLSIVVAMFDLVHYVGIYNMSLVVRKPAFCICENKDADQLRGYREADQCLCFHYMDSTIPLLP